MISSVLFGLVFVWIVVSMVLVDGDVNILLYMVVFSIFLLI